MKRQKQRRVVAGQMCTFKTYWDILGNKMETMNIACLASFVFSRSHADLQFFVCGVVLCQVCIRRNLLSQPMFAIVLTVFRGSMVTQKGGKKKAGPPKPFCVEIAAMLCAQIHVVVLDRTGPNMFEGTPVSPVLRLDPHTDHVLAQVPASHFNVHVDDFALKVEINDQSIEGLNALKKAKPTLASTAFWFCMCPCFDVQLCL